MKKMLVLLALCNAIAFFAIAQSPFSVGLKGGISIPNLTSGSNNNNKAADGWSSSLGPYFGIVSEYKLQGRWALQAEFNYSSQGGKKDGMQALPTGELAGSVPGGFPIPDYIYANFKTVAKLNYLELPVMIKYSLPLNDTWSLFFDAGPYAGLLLSAKFVSSGSSNLYSDEGETNQFLPELVPQSIDFNGTQDLKSDLKSFNFGIQGGIGAAYDCGHGKLFVTAGGNYGFIPVQKDSNNGQNNTGAVTLTLGYLYHLK